MDNQIKLLFIFVILFLVGVVVYSFWPWGEVVAGKEVAVSGSGVSVTKVTGWKDSVGESNPNVEKVGVSSIKTDIRPIVWNSTPPVDKVTHYQPVDRVEGDQAQALVQIGGEAYELVPNEIGHFDQLTVSPKANINIQLAYPLGQPGDVVALEVEDGGNIDGKGIAKVMKLDNNGQLAFDFKVNDEEGIYRVEVTKGADTKLLAFWVSGHK